MKLNNQQKQAVEYLDGPLLVLAGPGTGKTQLLSERVAYILKNTDTNADNVLCLTFTDSGAKNMRDRLKTIIGMDALKVNIGTYHAFGQEILAQYKNYSLEYNRRLDTAIDEVTQFKIIKSLQGKLPAMDILRGDKINDIISVISEAKTAELTPADLRKIAEINLEDMKVISEAFSPILVGKQPRKYTVTIENIYQPMLDTIKNYENVKPIVPVVERLISALVRELKTAIDDAWATESTKPLTAWRNLNFDKDENGNFCLKGKVSNKKLLSAANIMESYDEYLKENGLFDFDDMIEEAIKALRSDPGFKMTLQERYQHIMLDEFQDTNPSQFAIIKELTDYEKPMVMAVGDDDQAIFEFQGALSSNLKDYCDYYDAKVIELTENYRSTQEILDYSTEIIKQAPDRFRPNKTLHANLPNPESSQIYRYEFDAADAEYGFVAKRIHELIEAGTPQSEIAVISYKSKYFEPLLAFLKTYPEIKIAYEKRDNLFNDEKIHEILTILKYVYEMANEQKHTVQLMEIALYPCFNLPALEVVKLLDEARANHADALVQMGQSENENIQNFTNLIVNLVAKSYSETVETMIDFVVGARELNGFTSPFLNYYEKTASEYGLFNLYENIASLRAKLESHFAGEDRLLKLSDLVQMIDDFEMAGVALNTKSPYRDALDAVQILTAHKAKGLEFKYVFIISTDNNAWGKSKGNNNFLFLPKNLEQIRHTGMTDGERLRILYVALTRAKSAIYITNSMADFTDKKRERLDYLKEYPEGDKVVSEILPTREVAKVNIKDDETEKIRNIKSWLQTSIVESPDMRLYYKSKVENFRMSASALTTFVDIVYSGPETFFRSYVLGLREPETEAMAFGTLMHQTFEKVTNEQISDEEAVKYFLDELEKYDITSEIRAVLREKGSVNLAESLKEFGPIIRDGKAELSFSSEHLVVDGVPMTGKIDHILIDDKTKTIEIFDYKTGSFHPEKWQSHPALFCQMLQLIFYKVLLNNSREYKNYKVTKGHILYVVKDKNDDKVHQKTYIYNEEDEELFKKLLKIVFNYATSLDFLDDSEVFIAPDKQRTMKVVRDFIELLLEKNRL